MSIATGTLTVNAAFLQEIKEDSREFRQLLCQSVEVLSDDQPQRVDARGLLDLLCKLRDQLALHFTLEEAYGYFEDALDAAPQLSEQAEALRNEHQSLFAQLIHIVDLADQLCKGDENVGLRMKIARLFHAFRADLQLHESRENDLIWAAFNDDVGCGD